jgi:hypothetical protein
LRSAALRGLAALERFQLHLGVRDEGEVGHLVPPAKLVRGLPQVVEFTLAVRPFHLGAAVFPDGLVGGVASAPQETRPPLFGGRLLGGEQWREELTVHENGWRNLG